METVTGAMSTLLPKLAELLTDEYKLQKAVRGEIMFLKAEMESMQAALMEISVVPVDQLNEQVKVWARGVRELSYDMEDSVDAFMVGVDACGSSEPHGLKGFISRSLNLLTAFKTRRRIATEIQRIKKDVEEVSKRRERYRLGDGVAKPRTASIDPRLLALYKDEAQLVGIHGRRDELVKLLSAQGDAASRPRRLKVVSIVGVGGLGKTTLANAVYRQLEGQFKCGAFVSVSMKPDIKKIFSNILRQISTQQDVANTEAWDDKDVVDKIRQLLKDKRYLIVIDDIWDDSAWTVIRCALIENRCGSRIITTTRKSSVAQCCCSGVDGTVYELKHLSDSDSGELFYKRIFGKEDECPPELKEVSEKILKKCGGLPLAIITTASLLATKTTKTKDQWHSLHNSIGSGLERSSTMEDMRRILSLSYYDLPSHLRNCLLYLCIFPEDYEIGRHRLVWRWIAEGFIHEKQGQISYELGESYYNELINRSLIQPIGFDTYDRAAYCRVHDMVLDLIISLSVEENFVTILQSKHETTLPNKIRRLSLQYNNGESVIPQLTVSMSHVRSLTVFSNSHLMQPLSSFLHLRVLDLKLHGHQRVDICHKDIWNLVHLRYLRLGWIRITEIPDEIKNLKFLQTLRIQQTDIRKLPPAVVQLRQLMCLHVEQWVGLPDGVGRMKSLHELSGYIHVNSPNLRNELGNLTELRLLDIHIDKWDESYEEPLIQCLCNMGKLRKLKLRLVDCHTLDFISGSLCLPRYLQCLWLCNRFSTLPRWISLLLDLSSLSIRVNQLRQEDLQMLGELPALRFLNLGVTNPGEERLVVGTDCAFRCLTELEVWSDAMGLMFAQGAMQRLEKLRLYLDVRMTKDKYGDFDIGLENLHSLTSFHVAMHGQNDGVEGGREEDDAEAAMRNAIDKNPNHPRFNLIFSATFRIPEVTSNRGRSLMKSVLGFMRCWGKATTSSPKIEE